MRKNVKKQLALRVLSTAALVAMVSSIATAAFAAEYNVKDGSVEIVAKDGSQSITQWADKDNNLCVKDGEGKDIRDREDSNIILTTKNKDTGETETTSNTVTITAENKGDTANVTLKDVDIETESSWNNSGSAPIEIKGNGNTNLELNGDNTVLSGDRHHAAIEKADKNGHGTLTIKDDLNDDNSTPKDKDENGNAAGGDTGKLLAAVTGMVLVSAVASKIQRICPMRILPTLQLRAVRSLPAAVMRMVQASAAAPTVTQKTSALKAMLTSRQAEMAVQALAAVPKATMSLLPETPLSMPIANLVPPSAMAVRGEGAIRPSRSPATPRSMPRAKMQQRQSVPAKMAIAEILRSQLRIMPM